MKAMYNIRKNKNQFSSTTPESSPQDILSINALAFHVEHNTLNTKSINVDLDFDTMSNLLTISKKFHTENTSKLICSIVNTFLKIEKENELLSEKHQQLGVKFQYLKKLVKDHFFTADIIKSIITNQ